MHESIIKKQTSKYSATSSGSGKFIRTETIICNFNIKRTHRARNNFRIGSGHDDRPNSFLLGHVSFLAGQMYNYDELLFYITHVAD